MGRGCVTLEGPSDVTIGDRSLTGGYSLCTITCPSQNKVRTLLPSLSLCYYTHRCTATHNELNMVILLERTSPLGILLIASFDYITRNGLKGVHTHTHTHIHTHTHTHTHTQTQTHTRERERETESERDLSPGSQGELPKIRIQA